MTGAYSIGGKNYYFKEDGSQVKGDFVKNADGSLSYYDKDQVSVSITVSWQLVTMFGTTSKMVRL